MDKMKSFYDSHMHFLGIGINLLEYIDLGETSSFADILDTFQKETSRSFIIARGWNQTFLSEGTMFDKTLLNQVSKNIPIVAIRTCGHVLVCNDAMMSYCGVTKSTPQVDGGTFDINTGLFTENALKLIYDCFPKPDKNRIKEYMVAANQYLLSLGITACGSDDFSTISVDYETIISCYLELYSEHKIQVRIYQQVNLPSISLLKDFITKGYVNKSYGSFKMGPLKLLADGSLGARTAYLNKPYSDDPSTQGIKVFSKEELEDLVYLADSNQMDVAVHAIGDGMIDQVIDAIESSLKKTKRMTHRHSIIHAQLATQAQIDRMKKLNIAAQVQPIFLNSDIAIIKDRIGERSNDSYLFHSMYDKGVITCFGTDSPVEPLNPFYNLYSAITRCSIKNPGLPPFLIEEAFSIEEAIMCYTETSYYLSYDETNNINDYIIINQDITKVSALELLKTEVLETYIDDVLVYKKVNS